MNENKIAKALQWVVNQIPDFKPKTNDEKFILAVKLYCDAGVKEIKRLEAELQKLKSNTYSFTAAFDHMQQARVDYLEYRAETAERALLFLCDKTMSDISVMVFPNTKTQVQNKQELYDYCIKQAALAVEEE